jgi:hypothetical protein
MEIEESKGKLKSRNGIVEREMEESKEKLKESQRSEPAISR